MRAKFDGGLCSRALLSFPLESMYHLSPGQMSIMPAAIDMLSRHNNNNTHQNQALTCPRIIAV